jgi:DNA-binding CsgD family transcriptional regulator
MEPAVELLRNLHELTSAEADLVSHLARGHSLEEAAAARGVSINTARTQIKQVFLKTGTRRQGEVVQLVLRCFMPMAEQ